MDLWGKINKQLIKQNLTIYALTKKSGIAENILYELKSGRTNDLKFSTICKIAAALDVSLDEFK